MATRPYLQNDPTGAGLREQETVESSAGAGDDGQIPSLDAVGRLDTSFTRRTPEQETGTTYTIDAGDEDRTKRFSNAAEVTVTIPTDATDLLGDGFRSFLVAEGAGGITLDTTGLTIIGAPPLPVLQNEALMIQRVAADTWAAILIPASPIVQQDSADLGRRIYVRFSGDPAATGLRRGDIVLTEA